MHAQRVVGIDHAHSRIWFTFASLQISRGMSDTLNQEFLHNTVQSYTQIWFDLSFYEQMKGLVLEEPVEVSRDQTNLRWEEACMPATYSNMESKLTIDYKAVWGASKWSPQNYNHKEAMLSMWKQTIMPAGTPQQMPMHEQNTCTWVRFRCVVKIMSNWVSQLKVTQSYSASIPPKQ